MGAVLCAQHGVNLGYEITASGVGWQRPFDTASYSTCWARQRWQLNQDRHANRTMGAVNLLSSVLCENQNAGKRRNRDQETEMKNGRAKSKEESKSCRMCFTANHGRERGWMRNSKKKKKKKLSGSAWSAHCCLCTLNTHIQLSAIWSINI